MSLAIKDMLLIEEPTVQILKDELMNVSRWFVLPSFVIALCLEYFGELKFNDVIKKLILILAFIGAFYTFHKTGVDLSFKASEEILRKVSPRNIFLRSWAEVKVKTTDNSSWNILQKFAIPNINDLLGTSFFLLSKVFIWILKLIYSTVYHLTYVFAPLTAILYFFPITRNSISGTIQSSLWCMLMPIVLVSILAIVGNSIQSPAQNGSLSIVSIDQILWLFGVTLILLMSPLLTLGILRGGGVAMSGSAIGVMMTSAGMKFITSLPHAGNLVRSGVNKFTKAPIKLSDHVMNKGGSNNYKSSLGNSIGFNKSKNLSQKFDASKNTNIPKENISSFSKSNQTSNAIKETKGGNQHVITNKAKQVTESTQATSPNRNSMKTSEVQVQNNNKKMEVSTSRNNQSYSKESKVAQGKVVFKPVANKLTANHSDVKLDQKQIKPFNLGVKNEVRNI